MSQQALIQAEAGADIIAPSDMMDGRIGIIRDTLDNEGFNKTIILSYAAKFASNFYGPFRDAVGSSKSLNKADKKSYQMSYKNSNEAIREVGMDINEGADMVMVKPALPYLDIIYKIKKKFNIPIFAYQVSGEFSMIKFCEKEKIINYEETLYETLIAIKRSGASAIFCYGALDIAKNFTRSKSGISLSLARSSTLSLKDNQDISLLIYLLELENSSEYLFDLFLIFFIIECIINISYRPNFHIISLLGSDLSWRVMQKN